MAVLVVYDWYVHILFVFLPMYASFIYIYIYIYVCLLCLGCV